MKKLVSALQVQGLTAPEARKAAKAFIQHLQGAVLAGDKIDLGFMNLRLRKKPPVEVRGNLPTMRGRGGHQVFCIGERSVWSMRVHKSWLKSSHPDWSRF